MTHRSLILLGLAVAQMECAATAAVSVTPSGANVTLTNLGGGHWTIRFNQNASGTYNVDATGTDTIDWIESDSTATPGPTLNMQSFAASVGHVGTDSSGKLKAAALLTSGDLGGSGALAGVRVRGLDFVSVGGDLTGPINILNTGATVDIGTLLFQTGTLRASITNPYGGIGQIVASAATGASTSSRISISCRDTLAQLSITGDATWVNIVDPQPAPATPTMTIQDVTIVGTLKGDVRAARLNRPKLSQSFFSIGQDYLGTFYLSDGFTVDGCDDTDPGYYTLLIGRSLLSGAVIQTPAFTPGANCTNTGGFQSQIVVNANERPDTPGGGVMAGVGLLGPDFNTGVTVAGGSVGTSTEGQYPNPVSQIGPGAIGLAPFRTDGTESKIWFLPVGSTSPTSYSEPSVGAPIIKPYAGGGYERIFCDLVFYGPITNLDGTPPGDQFVSVEKRRLRSNGPDCWQDVSSDFDFKFLFYPVRHLQVYGDYGNSGCTGHDYCNFTWAPQFTGYLFENHTAYRIRPHARITDGQKLASVVNPANNYTDNPLVYGDPVEFDVGCNCPSDLNNDNAITTPDLTLFLSRFGQHQACEPGPLLNEDLNGDGDVNTADLTILLAAFGQTCCTGAMIALHGEHMAALSHGIDRVPLGDHAAQHQDDANENGNASPTQQVNFPPPTGPLLAALGFTSIEQYQAYVDGLTPQQQVTHIQFLIALARALGYE